MLVSDPEEAKKARLSLQTMSNGRRDMQKFKQILTTWSRTRETSLGNKWLEVDKPEFKAHWKGRGRKKKQIKKMWKAAIKPAMFQKKMARRVGKKILVWVLQPRQMTDRDIIANSLSHTGSPMLMGEEQMQDVLTGSQRLSAPKGAKNMFNGMGSIVDQEDPRADAEDGDDSDDGSDSDSDDKKDKKDKKKKGSSSSGSSSNSSTSSSDDDSVSGEEPPEKKRKKKDKDKDKDKAAVEIPGIGLKHKSKITLERFF